MVKCPCGEKATGSVNEQPFCNKPSCIENAMKAAVEPVKQPMARRGDGDRRRGVLTT